MRTIAHSAGVRACIRPRGPGRRITGRLKGRRPTVDMLTNPVVSSVLVVAGEYRRFDPAWLNPFKIRSAHVPESHGVVQLESVPCLCLTQAAAETLQLTEDTVPSVPQSNLWICTLTYAKVHVDVEQGECKCGSTGFIWNADSTGCAAEALRSARAFRELLGNGSNQPFYSIYISVGICPL